MRGLGSDASNEPQCAQSLWVQRWRAFSVHTRKGWKNSPKGDEKGLELMILG